MKAELICYELEGISSTNRRMLHKKLYGYKDQSHQGKYTYDRPGLLQEVDGKKIIDAVLLVKSKKEAKKVIDLLHEHGAETYIFDVLSKIEF